MRKTFLKVSFLAALGVAMSASFTSCKDYDDDIKRIDSEIAAIQESVKKIQDLVSSGSVITKVTQNGAGVTFTLSNGESYTVTNGKDGENGKDGVNGKDADVWTIEKNAEGVWYWAKNGELTDVPAQGPKGEQGEAGKPGDGLPGNYYVPNEETGCFDLYDGKTNELIEATDIRWKPADEEQIAAVDCGDYVVITGLKGYDQPLKIWKSSYIKSLVVKPELYLDGIEAVRYGIIQDIELKKLNRTGGNGLAVENVNESKVYNNGTPNATGTITANIAANQPSSLSTADKVGGVIPTFYAMEKATIKYAVNPSNAAISKVKWDLAFDDIEVVNRSSYIGGEVLSNSEIDENGDVTLTYQLNDYAYGYLAPFIAYNSDNSVWDGSKPNQWTFMAVKAQVNDEDSLVTSDNVAVVAKQIVLQDIIVDANVPVKYTADGNTAVPVASTAANAIKYAYDATATQTPVPVLAIPYNEQFNLASHLAISTLQCTPMIDGGSWKSKYVEVYNEETQQMEGKWVEYWDSKDAMNSSYVPSQNKSTVVMTLAEAAEKWGLTMNYQLVNYTVNPNKTSESAFATINATTGMVQPMYVNDAGTSVAVPGGESSVGRSAIGRRPLVYVSLTDEYGNIVLGGFVKLEITEKAPASQSMVIKSADVPYICYYNVQSTWEEISGKVYEELGVTPTEFSKDFRLSDATTVNGIATTENVYMLNEKGEMVQTTANGNWMKGSAYYGSFSWDSNHDGSHTQKLVFEMYNDNLETWYPTFKSNGAFDKYVPTSTPVTKTVYAKFESQAYNRVVYIGFNVTVVGLPAADYKGQLFSSWSQNYTVTPVNPAVPGQTEKGIYGTNNSYNYAQVMGMNFTSAWEGGDPAVNNSNKAYNWVNSWTNASIFAVDNVTANYRFAAKQPEYVGRTGAKYAIARNRVLYPSTDNAIYDVHALNAYKYDQWGNVDKSKNGQPIAVINANNAIRNELGNTEGTIFGTTNQNGSVWNRIDFLSVYGIGANNEVLSPAYDTAPTNGWNYGAFACDIINAEAYDFNNPAITFNIEMVVTYSQNPAYLNNTKMAACQLVIPGTFDFKAGVGRPVSLADEKSASLQDAKDDAVLASQLFQMVDWQGHKLWNVNSKGAVSNSTFNSTILGDYWMSIGTTAPTDYNNVAWPSLPAANNISNASFKIDLANAVVGTAADGSANLGKFVDVYTDKHIAFDIASGVSATQSGNVATVTNWRDLDDVKVTWTNNGNSVTQNIYIFIPVRINYIWGQDVLLGNAVLTIQPTLQGN